MADIIPFRFGQQEIHVRLDEDGNPWWVLNECAEVIALNDIAKLASRIDTEDKRKTPVLDARGVLQESWEINESGLYTVLLRSNKPAAKSFRRWVTREVLPSIRKTGRYEMPGVASSHAGEQASIAMQQARIALYREHAALMRDLGMFDDRDKLMIADLERQNILGIAQTPPSVPSTSAERVPTADNELMFFVADRVRTLGYHLTRKDEASLMSPLGRRVAKEYRHRHKKEPVEANRYVDGALRPVYCYAVTEQVWMDSVIQAFMAETGHTRSLDKDAIS